MEPLIPTLTFEQLRQAKKNASSTLTSLGIELSSSTTGNLVASTLGYKDWNTAKALTSENNTQSKKVESQHLIPSHLGDMSQDLQNYYDEIDTPHHPALSAPDDMSPSDRSIFIQAVRDCAMSIRLSHLDGIASVSDNKTMVDTMLESAISLTYQQYANEAKLSHLIESIGSTRISSSMLPIKEDILYILSAKDSHLPINYYGAVINAGIKRKPKVEPIKYELAEVERSGIFDYVKELAGSTVSFEEKHLFKAENISFIPSQSSALYGVTGCGKSHLMLDWANALENDPDGMPYVYLLTKRHRSSTVLGNIKVKTPEAIFDWKDQSGIIFVGNDDFATYRGLLQKAMSDGRHIFIDENVFLFEMLDEVINAGYQNYTVAMQSVRFLLERNTGDMARYAFERVLIGKQNEVSTIHYFGRMNTAIEMPIVSRIPRGEFYLLRSTQAESSFSS